MFYYNNKTEKIMFSTVDGCLWLVDNLNGFNPQAAFNSKIGAKYSFIEVNKDMNLPEMEKATAQLMIEVEAKRLETEKLEKFNAMSFWDRNPDIAVIKNKRVGPRTSRLFGGTEVGVSPTDFKEVQAIFKDFELLVDDSSVIYVDREGNCYGHEWESLGRATTDAGEVIMSFDKRFKGKKIKDIHANNLVWFAENVTAPKPFQLKAMVAIKEYLRENDIDYDGSTKITF
tara:strand:- start:4009 stop:4695 length:687 start_codon:yes stop_codon:yes gene_type:complete